MRRRTRSWSLLRRSGSEREEPADCCKFVQGGTLLEGASTSLRRLQRLLAARPTASTAGSRTAASSSKAVSPSRRRGVEILNSGTVDPLPRLAQSSSGSRRSLTAPLVDRRCVD